MEEKKETISAIKKLQFKLTPADLAANSRLSINQASFWLNKVAGETKGNLEVAGDGTIMYSFSPHFEEAYIKRGFRKIFLWIAVFLFKALYWAIRVSFGLALILSILVIVVLITLIIVAAVAAMFGDNNGGGDLGDGGFDIMGGFFDPNLLFDIFNWNWSPGISYYPNSVPSRRQQKYQDFNENHPKGNFFYECFSFLFGDGAPNSNLQEIRWTQIARVIKEYGGVVSAEQLAPYLDGDGSDSGMIMSALAQFNGRPEVTPSGFIVYVFPDFIDPASSPQLPRMDRELYLREDHWRFSAYSVDKWSVVLVLALMNFAGSWWLFKHIATINLLQHVAVLIDVLLSYAALFLLIPAIRFLVLLWLNSRVDARNERRRAALAVLQNPTADISKELAEAAQVRAEELAKIQPDRRIIYNTQLDYLEQQFGEQGKG